MKVQILYEGKDYAVLRRIRLLGINHPYFSAYYVLNNARENAIKLKGAEKRFLFIALGGFTRLGLDASKIRESGFFEQFAEAVASRGGLRWHVFFNELSPVEIAQNYSDGVTT